MRGSKAKLIHRLALHIWNTNPKRKEMPLSRIEKTLKRSYKLKGFEIHSGVVVNAKGVVEKF